MTKFEDILSERRRKKEYGGYSDYASDEKKNNEVSFEGIMAERAKAKIQNSIGGWINNSYRLADEYSARYFDSEGNYKNSYRSDTEDWLKKTKMRSHSLTAEASDIKELLNKYRNYYDDDFVFDITDAIDSGVKNLEEMVSVSSDDRDYFSQWANEEDYNQAVKEYGWQQKYSGKTYGELKGLTESDEYSASQEEDKWLKSFMLHDIDVIDSMSEADVRELKKDRENKRNELKKERGELFNELSSLMTRTFIADKEGKAVKDLRDKIKSLDKQIEELGDSFILYSDKDNPDDAVTLDGLLRVKKAENSLAYINAGLESKQLYNALKQYDSDIRDITQLENIVNSVSYATLDKSTVEERLKSEEQATGLNYEYERKLFKYFTENYGFDFNKEPEEVIKQIDELNAQYEANKKSLANLGYDWNEMSYYEDWKADKAAYKEKQEKNRKFASDHPAAATIINILSAPAQGAEFIGNAFNSLRAGEDSAYGLANIYNDDATNFAQTTTAAIADKISTDVLKSTDSEFLSWLASNTYSGVSSSLQSAATIAMSSIFGPAGNAAALGIMGSSAANSAFQQAVKNGSTNGEALATGLAAGSAEALFEYFSLSNLKGIKKVLDSQSWNVSSLSALLKSIGKNSGKVVIQGLVEASEEGATDIFNLIADNIINGDHSAYETEIKKLVNDGYSREKAEQIASKDWLMDLMSSIYGGFIGGMTSGGVQTTVNSMLSAPAAVKNTVALMHEREAIGANVIKNNALNQLAENINKTENTPPNRKLKKSAEKVIGITESGKDISKRTFRNIGKLYEGVQTAQAEQLRQSEKQAVREAIKSEVRSRGIKNADEAAKVIYKAVYGQLSAKENSIFESADGADIVNKILNSEEVKAKTQEKAAENFGKIIQTAEMASGRSDSVRPAMPENRFEVNPEGETVNTKTNEPIVITGVASVNDGEMLLKTESGETVNAADVSFASEGEALLYSTVLDMGVGAGVAESLIKNFDPQGNIPAVDYALGIEEAYRYGRYHIPVREMSLIGFSAVLTEQQKMHAYNLGAARAEAETAERQARVNAGETKNTADGGSVKYQNRITADMTDNERAEILRNKTIINIADVKKISENNDLRITEISSWDDINKVFGSKKRALIQKIASEFGVFKNYNNKDINLSFDFSNNNFRESYHKQKVNYEQFSKMFSVFDSVIEKAVGVEIHNRENYKPDVTLNNVYVLISAFADGDFVIPVKLEIKEFKDKPNTLYVAIALEKIKMTEVSKQGTTENGVAQNSRSVTISISDLLSKINPKDINFLKYIPDELLNENQIEAKRAYFEKEKDTAERAGGVNNNSGLSPTDNVSDNSMPNSAGNVKENTAYSGKNKGNLAITPSENNLFPQTSETLNGTVSTNSIPNSAENVKQNNKAKGKVHIGVSVNSMTERQKTSLAAIGRIVSEVTHNDVYIYESVEKDGKRVFKNDTAGYKAGESAPNGFYVSDTGEIYIDLNAGNSGEGLMLFTMAHEITHFIRQWSPAKFKILADFLMEQYGRKGISVDTLIREQIDKAKRNGRDIDYDEGYEEVISSSMEGMLADGKVFEKLALLKERDAGLVEKIKSIIQSLINRIKKAYAGLTPESREGKLVAGMIDIAEKMRDLLTDALIDAGENFSNADVQKNTAVRKDNKNSFRDTNNSLANKSLLPYDNELNEIIEQHGDYIIDSYDKLKNIVNIAFDNPNLKATAYFGIIPSEILNKIEKSIPNIPKELNGKLFKPGKTYSVAATLDSIQHLTDNKKLSRNDIINYLDRMADTIIDFDTVNFDYYYKGNLKSKGIIFKKTFSDGTIQSFEIVSNKKRTLNLQTIYMESGDYQKKKSSETLLMEKPSADVQDAGRSDFNNSIPNSDKNVKTKTDNKHSDRDYSAGKTAENRYWYPNMSKSDIAYVRRRAKYELSTTDNYIDAENKWLYNEKNGQTFFALYSTADVNEPTILYACKGARAKFEHQVFSKSFEKFEKEVDNNGGIYSRTKIIESILGDYGYASTGSSISNNDVVGGRSNSGNAGVYSKNSRNRPSEALFNCLRNIREIQKRNERNGLEKHSDRDYSYEALTAKRDLSIIELNDVSAKKFSAYQNKNVFAKEMLKIAKTEKNPKNSDTAVYLYCDDIEKNIMIGRDSFKHGAARIDETYIAVCEKLPAIMKKSIAVNELLPRNNTNGAVILLGMAENTNNYVVVRMIVNNKTWKLDNYDILYAIQKKSIKKEDAGVKPQDYLNKEGSPTSSIISIADLLDIVKNEKIALDVFSMDVLDKIGKLRNENSQFANSLKFSDRDPDAVSNRALLSRALETAAQNEIELKRLREYQSKAALIDAEQKRLSDLRAEIKELSFAKGKRDTEKLAGLHEEAAKTANRLDIYDRQLLRLEAAKPLKALLERERTAAEKRQRQRDDENLRAYREKALEKQQTITEKYREARRKAVESRRKTMTRNKIKRVIKQLDGLLNRGNREKNVKIGLRETVSSALAASEILFSDVIENADIVRRGVEISVKEDASALGKYAKLLKQRDAYEGRIAALEGDSTAERKSAELNGMLKKLDGKIKKLDKQLAKVFEAERERLNRADAAEVLTALAEAYRGLRYSGDEYIKNAYDSGVQERLDALKESIGGTPVRDMSLSQLEEVYKTFRAVEHTVRTANSLFREGRTEDLRETTAAVQGEIRKAARAGLRDPLAAVDRKAEGIRSFMWNELKPYYAFERLGSETYTRLFWDAVEGESTYGRDIDEAHRYITGLMEKYGFKKWDMSTATVFKTPSGQDFRLTLDDMLSVYAYSKREQAYRHMTEGGFTFDRGSTYRDEKTGLMKKHRAMTETYRVSEELIDKITDTLTAEQKQFADGMLEYLEVMADKGNEVSRELYGIDLFTEKNYFPLKTEKDYRSADEQALGGVQLQSSLKNAGMTRQTVPGANNPIVLSGFTYVIVNHIDGMAKYHGLVLPIENLRRVFNNVSVSGTGGYISTQALIKAVYGESAVKYFDRYIADLNGGIMSGDIQSPLMNLFSRMKGTAVAANLSVAIQQPFAITRAWAEINPKYFIPFMKKEASAAETRSQWEELKKYAPIAVIKEMGGFDVGSGRAGNEYVAASQRRKGASGFAKNASDLMMWGAETGDKIGWSTIWRAVKKEAADRQGLTPGTEEFYKAAGKRFTEIVVKTQVYDSVNSRSGFMRSKSDLMKFATSFMGEPTAVYNMAFSAALDFKRAVQSREGVMKASMRLLRVSGALLISIALNNAFKALVYAMRDDDEDEAYWERYAKQSAQQLKSDLNPFNLLPITRDIVSIFEGWEVERPDMTLIADLITSAKKLSGGDGGTEEWLDFAGALGNITGIPFKNICREIEGAVNVFGDITDGREATDVSGAFITGWNGSNDFTLKDRAERAAGRGDYAEVKRIADEMTERKLGDVQGEERVEAEKKARGTVKASFTSTYKKQYIKAAENRDYDEMSRIRRLLHATGLYGTLSELDETLERWRTSE